MNTNQAEELVIKNQQLVFFTYHKLKKTPFTVRNREDLIGAGNLGLVKAAKSFDPQKSNFSTYAIICIRTQMFQFMRMMKKHQGILSLDAPIETGKDYEITLANFISDSHEYENHAIANVMINDIFNRVSKRDAKILELKLKGFRQHEIGKAVHLKQTQISRLLSKIKNKYGEQDEKTYCHN